MSGVEHHCLIRAIVDVASHRWPRKAIGAPKFCPRPPKVHSVKVCLVAEFVVDADERLIVSVSSRTGGGIVVEFASARVIH